MHLGHDSILTHSDPAHLPVHGLWAKSGRHEEHLALALQGRQLAWRQSSVQIKYIQVWWQGSEVKDKGAKHFQTELRV